MMNIFKNLKEVLLLRSLQAAREKVNVSYENEFKRLIKSGKTEEEAQTFAAAKFKVDIRATYSNYIFYQSEKFLRKAERLMIPLPEGEKYWGQLKYTPHRHLSEDGQHYLRKEIQDEEQKRREVVSFWFNIIKIILSLLVASLAIVIK